jgi:hypothetical protein
MPVRFSYVGWAFKSYSANALRISLHHRHFMEVSSVRSQVGAYGALPPPEAGG